jgi:hypothetical protein
MKIHTFVRVGYAIIAGLLLLPSALVAAQIQFDDIAVLKGMLPRQTKVYEIDPVVMQKGPYYQFKVKADHGAYEVESIRNLLKVCHEIRMMEQYKATDEGGEVWKGFSGSLKGLGTGAKAIVTNPNQARKAIGRSLSKTGRSIGRLFSRDKEDEPKSSSGADRDTAAGGKYYGKTARIFAYDLKLDVYTDNPYAHELIGEAAKREAMGKLVISGALLVSPIPGLYVTLYGAMTPDSIDGETERLIRDNLPSELRFQLARKYAQANGLDRKKDARTIAAYNAFLENPNFNPREIAYLATYLNQLKDAANLGGAIAQLGKIAKVGDAVFITAQYELLATLNKRVGKVARLVPVGTMIGAVNEAGGFVMATSHDVAGNSAELTAVRKQILSAKRKSKAKTATLYVIGPADKSFARASAKSGLTVTDNLLKHPAFKAPAAKK